MKRILALFDVDDFELVIRLLVLLGIVLGSVAVLGAALRVFRWLSGV